MTKLIAIFIIVLAIFAGWKLVAYYQKVAEESQKAEKVEMGANIRPEELPGLSWNLQSSLQAAQKNGATGLRDWLKAYGAQVHDPRKAWIEMDYCMAILRDDPNEAKRIFNSVRERTKTNSPVYPRIRQLEKTFQ